jgi:hypothetical protein
MKPIKSIIVSVLQNKLILLLIAINIVIIIFGYFGYKELEKSCGKLDSLVTNNSTSQKSLFSKSDYLVCKLDQSGNYKPDITFDRDTFQYNTDQSTSTISSFVDKNKVFVRLNENNEYSEIKNANEKNFKQLPNLFSKVDNVIYYRNEKISNSDSDTFAIVNTLVAKDKNNCYFVDNNKIVNPKCDGSSLQFAQNSSYFTDGENCFDYKGSSVDCSTANKVDLGEISGVKFSSLKDQLFIDDVKFEAISSVRFSRINDVYFKTKDSCYKVFDKKPVKLEFCDPETFKSLDNQYAIDKNYVYSSWNSKNTQTDIASNTFENADPKTFIPTPDVDYDGDGTHCYYKGVSMNVECSGNKLSKFYNENKYDGEFRKTAKDDKNIYYEGKKLNIDLATYIPLNEVFSKDKNGIYFGWQKLDGVDEESFKPIDKSTLDSRYKGFYPTQYGEYYGKDKKNLYFGKFVVKDVDLNTFTVEEVKNAPFPFYKDKDSYFCGEKRQPDCNYLYYSSHKTTE